MEKHCNKCSSNEIDELVWVNQISGEVTAREDQFFCNQCGAKVDIVLAEPKSFWIEDVEPLSEQTSTQIIDEIIKGELQSESNTGGTLNT